MALKLGYLAGLLPVGPLVMKVVNPPKTVEIHIASEKEIPIVRPFKD